MKEIIWQVDFFRHPCLHRANHRVGYGGGFYDRYLEKHPQLERVAIAFSFQMLPEVPTEPTDICPQIIVTEEEICYLTD